MNRRGKTSGMMVTLVVIASILAVAVGLLTWGVLQQTTLVKPEPGKVTVATSLIGKAATLDINVYDLSQDNQKTRRGVPIYIQDTNENWVVSGGTTSSATTSQAVTSGISVIDKPYKILAFNATYGSPDGPVSKVISKESDSVDVNVYTIAGSLELTMYDKDDVAMSRSSANLSLGAGETSYFTKLRVKNNQTNSAFRLYGLYMDLNSATNISSVTINSGDVTIVKDGMPLSRTSNDDKSWKLETPKILYEFDQVDTGSIVVQADGDGTSGLLDSYTLYIVDGEYFYSELGKGVLGPSPENDATTPADVGAPDLSITGSFT